MALEKFNLQKLNPWNWFKHEQQGTGTTVPVRREDYQRDLNVNNPFAQLHQEIDRVFDSFGFPSAFGGSRGAWPSLFENWGTSAQSAQFNPNLNVAAEKDEYVVTLEAAGLDDKDISLEVADGQLIVAGNKREESENKDRHYYRIERRYGAFQRVLSLPEDAVADDIHAAMHKGLLTVRIPRREAETGDRRRITIEQH